MVCCPDLCESVLGIDGIERTSPQYTMKVPIRPVAQ